MAEAKRDPKGRFQAGTPGGPGRPKKQAASSYQISMRQVVDDQMWRHLVYSTYERAMKGDYRARDWLAKHLLTKEPLKIEKPDDQDDSLDAKGLSSP